MFKMKKYIPRSLFGRFTLIFAIPVLVVQLVAIYVFFYFYVDVISKNISRTIASEMRFVTDSINKGRSRKEINEFVKYVGIEYSVNRKKFRKLKKLDDSNWRRHKIYRYINPLPIIDPLNRFKLELKNQKLTPFEIYKVRKDNDILVINVTRGKNVVSFKILTKRIYSSSKYVFILWIVFTSILTSIVAIIFLRNQLRPLANLEGAAKKFGQGQSFPDLRPSGSRELRSLVREFRKMASRVTRQISQRTDMLSGVSHDLRTPLTRMKLVLEMSKEDSTIQGLKRDVIDMENLIEEYLDFARHQEREKIKKVDLISFIKKDVLQPYVKMGKNVECEIEIEEGRLANIKALGCKRAISNLIDNGLRYAELVKVSARVSRKNLMITIDDNGPGIPIEKRNRVFEPFFRIDESRNLDSSSSGSGLGMSIARDAITSQGGKIGLLDSSLGGLKVVIIIPIY